MVHTNCDRWCHPSPCAELAPPVAQARNESPTTALAGTTSIEAVILLHYPATVDYNITCS